MCFSCRSSESEDDEYPIADYSTRVNSRPIGKGPHFYGVELEVSVKTRHNRDNKAREVRALFGKNAICKHDGSIDYGFEIVTVPASLEEQRKMWTVFFQRVPVGLFSWGAADCGLHVHCSRAPLSLLTIGKVIVFVNDRKNLKFIEAIAGRRANDWAKFKDKKLTDAMHCPPERYEAVNLLNRRTIEFRIFKGTLRLTKVLMAIEFCDALIHFCQVAERSIADCRSVNNFIAYVRAHKKQWPNLTAFICAKWLREETNLTKKMGYQFTPLLSTVRPTEKPPMVQMALRSHSV